MKPGGAFKLGLSLHVLHHVLVELVAIEEDAVVVAARDDVRDAAVPDPLMVVPGVAAQAGASYIKNYRGSS